MSVFWWKQTVLIFEPNRGKRNDSSQIRYVIDKIAAIRGILPEEVEKQTEINARNMYGLLQ